MGTVGELTTTLVAIAAVYLACAAWFSAGQAERERPRGLLRRR